MSATVTADTLRAVSTSLNLQSPLILTVDINKSNIRLVQLYLQLYMIQELWLETIKWLSKDFDFDIDSLAREWIAIGFAA